MPETEIRRVLNYINDIRKRWQDAGLDYGIGNCIDIEPDSKTIDFYDPGYDGYTTSSLPWAAFTDPDETIARLKAEKEADEQRQAVAMRERRRQQYEALKAEFSPN